MSASQQGLLALLHRVNQVATERFAAALSDSELTPRQVQVLAAIEANEGASQTGIVNLTGVDRSTLADIIRRLSKRKLIERRRTREDARAYAVKLTAAGRSALASGRPALGNVEKNLLATLSAKQRSDFVALLEQVIVAGELQAAQKNHV